MTPGRRCLPPCSCACAVCRCFLPCWGSASAWSPPAWRGKDTAPPYVILGCFAAFCASGALGAFYGYFDPHSTRGQLSTDLTTFGAYFSANAHSAAGYVQGIWSIAIELFALALIGMVWARERVLFDVHAHRRTLTTWTCIAAAVVLLVGVPWGLSINGVLPAELESVFYVLNQGFGFLTGPGIIAGLALATEHLHNRVPGWSRAFVALGRRSMSGYIAQSFLFLLLVIPAGLGLWQDAGLAGKLLAGTVVWLITLALAVALEAAGRRGPFEWLHRRLSYGPAGKIEQNEASRYYSCWPRRILCAIRESNPEPTD